MADKNVIAIRADEETKAKFKAIAETFENNGIALESLLNAYEMQTAKGHIDRPQNRYRGLRHSFAGDFKCVSALFRDYREYN